MKCIKPMRLSTLHRVVEHERVPRFIITVIAGFAFDDPKRLVPEMELWPAVMEDLVDESSVLDEAMAKVRGEVLVSGSCYAPKGEPTAVSFVRLQCGKIDKRLAVIGDREWRRGVPTDPKPFTVMPIGWSRAFGGEGFDDNPIGRGVIEVQEDGVSLRPLPNVEHPKKLIAAPTDRPEPAGFGGIPITSPIRQKKAGTYDAKWLEERAFGFAADIDPTMFNVAVSDQWLDDYFTGEETFAVENMHPTRSRIEGSLPPLRPRVFVTQREDGTEEPVFKEVTMRLDTLRLFPHLELGVLVYRGSIDVADDDADDIVELLLAAEDQSQSRPASHYHQCIVDRRDHEKGGLLALRERDIMPPSELGWATHRPKGLIDELATPEHHLVANMKRRQKLEIDKAKQQVLDSGGNPDDFGWDEGPEVPEVDTDDWEAVIDQVDQMKAKQEEELAKVDERKKELNDMARDALAAQGIDFEEAMQQALKANAGPPKFDADKELEVLQENLTIARDAGQPLLELEQLVNDPDYVQSLHDAEARLLDAYRRGAHLQLPFEPLSREDSDIQRAEIEVAFHNEIKLEDLDYSGVDLSEMVLPGIDLSMGLMEAVNLSGTDLTGGDLSGTVLAHARLVDTKLQNAKLVGANVGGAELDGVDLSGSDLSQAIFQGCTIRRSRFVACNLAQANFMNTTFEGDVVLDEAYADLLAFYKLTLRGASLQRVKLTRCAFVECDFREADFRGADLSRTIFITCPMDGAKFEGAIMNGVQMVQDTTLSAADFRGVQANNAMLRSLDLRAARFEGAVLDGSDLSKSKLEQASFVGASAKQAMFIRSDLQRARMGKADLLGALLMKARLQATDLTGANLFQADLSLIKADGETKLDGADLGRARVHPKAK